VVKDGVLVCYPDREGRLRRDFGKFSISHKPPSRYKLEAVSDEYGHADVGTALVMMLPRAIQVLRGLGGLTPEDELTDTTEEEWEQKDVDSLPEGLREIYECD
jgi:hypothetical protein